MASALHPRLSCLASGAVSMEMGLTQQCFEIIQETGRVKVKREPGPEGGRPHEGLWVIRGPLELTKANP